MDYMDAYNKWLNNSIFDEATKNELKKIADNPKEIEDRFFKNLEFGTGGLRGVIGAGDNRMNIYTVRKATQGLANYILKQDADGLKMGVAIAYDSRRMSPEFADEAALVLAGNGIKAYVFDELRPTPELSFAVRYLGCIAGIVITASHNPPEYNGYKAYWSDGGQVPYPRDEEIINEVNKITDYSQIKIAEKSAAIENELYKSIGAEIDDAYIKSLQQLIINPAVIEKVSESLKIVYTPLHGTGNKPVRRVLGEVGFKNVTVVPEQELPDSNFSTVSYPNPEDPKAFTLALKLADQLAADIIIGTDPDADRVGVVVKNQNGEYAMLTGNMTGVLLTEYMLSQKKEAGMLPSNGAVISTIVSTNMTAEIAKSYGIEYIEVLTGFKYIGEKIKEFEEAADTGKSRDFIFGFEESYGSLAGTHSRDKDAVVSTLLICEMAAYYKTRNMTLYDGLQEIYAKYGFYMESVESISLKGVDGLENIKKIMYNLRQNPPLTIDGAKVSEVRDYKNSTQKNMETGQETILTLPVSDVLYYVLDDGSWFCIRPSGTEPKIKIYFGVKQDSERKAKEKLARVTEACMNAVGAANK